MTLWIITLLSVIVFVNSHPAVNEDSCEVINCIGDEYQCVNDRCYCTSGYIPNHSQTSCVKCPGLGEKCSRVCCNDEYNDTLYCWQGICRECYDSSGEWICRDSIDQVLIVSISQIAMATTLVLGIIATFVLMYKLCTTSNVRTFGTSSQTGSRLSIGSLQQDVNERLRDAPPRYTRAAPPDSSIYPAVCFLNAGFVHDSSIPPPPYEYQTKNENENQTEIHM